MVLRKLTQPLMCCSIGKTSTINWGLFRNVPITITKSTICMNKYIPYHSLCNRKGLQIDTNSGIKFGNSRMTNVNMA